MSTAQQFLIAVDDAVAAVAKMQRLRRELSKAARKNKPKDVKRTQKAREAAHA